VAIVVAKGEGYGANPESANSKTPKQRCDMREICTRTARLPAPEARPENSSALNTGFEPQKRHLVPAAVWSELDPFRENGATIFLVAKRRKHTAHGVSRG
jgi:hypothetical protein